MKMALMKKIKLKRIINMKECADKQNPVREPWESLLFTRMLKRRGGYLWSPTVYAVSSLWRCLSLWLDFIH